MQRLILTVFLFFLVIFHTPGLRAADSVVVFNEIMYHPRDDDGVEWVELFNQMAVDVELSGWEIEGIGYFFPTNTILGGGKYLVVASDPAELKRRTELTEVLGPFSGKLANDGERLRLRNQNHRIMDSLDYGTSYPWPVGPDGGGGSLAKRNPNLASKSGENWTDSSEAGGTPGMTNFPQGANRSTLLLSEVPAAGNREQPFWIELFNSSQETIEAGGSVVAFSKSAVSFQIPPGTVIAAGGYAAVEPVPTGYHPANGEKLFLYSADRKQLLDAIEVKSRAIARSTNQGDRWFYPATESPGTANPFSFETNIVINEIMFQPQVGDTNGAWVELFNRGSRSVDLRGWKLSGPDFYFPTNASLGPGEYLVVAQNAANLQAANPAIHVLGDFSGKLSGSSSLLELYDAFGNPADQIRYYDAEPWPEAGGSGASLELRDAHADNSKPEAWGASIGAGDWQSYSYSGTAGSDNGPTRWNEFIFGLLDAGEVLLDDFSVIENPGSNPREILKNGDFEAGAAFWRFLGTHRRAEVIADPKNSTNHVLHLLADGPTEHMHNHAETTLLNNQPIRNGTTYQISWRAKWLAGCNKLNTRLYFNRVARTTILQRPVASGTPGRINSIAVKNTGPTFTALLHQPVVPKATESVRVSIRAEDPDGLKSCVLWWGVNGTNWTSIPMTNSGELYAAVIPARPAATVVQFYIQAEDALGTSSFYPAEGRASRALYKVNDNQALSSRMHNVRLVMLPSEASALHASTNVMSNGRSLCTVIYDDAEVFYNCGLHLQSSERGRMDPSRVGFTVSFPADHLFRGVQDTITFDRSGGWSGRGGRQDEIVMRHVINQAGDSPDMYNDLVRVLAPQTTHTSTALLLMAKYGGNFIDGSDYPGDGSLFKLELIYYPTTSVGNNPELPKIPQPDDVTGVDLGNYGGGQEPYRWFFLSENHSGDDDYDGFIKVSQAFSLTGAALQQKTAELLDMEQWTRVFAFKSLSGDPDTYGFGLQHNQLFYVPPRGRALTFPWDMDFSWSRSPSDSINVGSKVGQVIHSIPANQRLYLGNLLDIIQTSFNTNYMARWTAHYGTVAGQNYSGILAYIGQRAASVRKQLPPPALFRITSFGGANFTTNATSVILRGTAPYTYKRLQRNIDPPGTGFNWPATETWETVVPLGPGLNSISIVAWDFHNRPVATNQIMITSSDPSRPDRDADGMPDDWEVQYGLNPALADGGLDTDVDGLSNFAEYLAGTSPIDRASGLRLGILRDQGQQFTLSFQAIKGRAYRMQYRVGVSSAWRDLLSIPVGTDDRTVTAPQTITPVAEALFYRVILDDPVR